MLSEQREFATPPPASIPSRLGLLVALLAGLVILAVAARQFRWGGFDRQGPRHPSVGKQLERLALEPLTGTDQPLGLGDLKNKVVLINFWGTWCGPCVVEFPHLAELAQHYHSQAGFQFVSVSCSGDGDDRDLAENTAAFLKEQQVAFPTFADPSEETRDAIARVAGERAIPYPTTVVLGRDGTVRALWFGYRDGLTDEMRDVIDAALAEKKG